MSAVPKKASPRYLSAGCGIKKAIPDIFPQGAEAEKPSQISFRRVRKQKSHPRYPSAGCGSRKAIPDIFPQGAGAKKQVRVPNLDGREGGFFVFWLEICEASCLRQNREKCDAEKAMVWYVME